MFELWKEYFRDLLAETADAYTQGAALDEARKSVATRLAATYAGKFPRPFPRT
jgi:hypothetical protein